MKDKKLRTRHLYDALRPGFYTFVKAVLSMMLVLFIHGNAFGQQVEVSGTVTGADGQPIPGVSILVLGTTTGTTTDIQGEYTLTAPSDGTLVFSFIGYVRQEVAIQGRSSISIVLQESVALLDELIVTGYSAQRRADITGAVASVDMESTTRQTSTSVLQRLDGRVAGVTVDAGGSPGARSTVRIRGVSSFQNNDPLYIIDGTPVQDSFMNFLNPNDIESIQVLKDASAASIYGSRANNGVIIIETKRGREGTPNVSVDLRTGFANAYRGYDDILILDALEYHEIVRRAHQNAGLPVPRNIYGDPNNPTIPNYIWPNDGSNQTMNVDESTYSFPNNLIMPASTGTNWWDEVFGTGITQDYNVSVSGGGSANRYNVSFNYFDQEGTAAYNRYQRGSIRINSEFDVGRVTFGESLSLSLDESYGGLSGDNLGEGTIVGQRMLAQPVIPVRDIAGNFAGGKANGLGTGANPLKIAWSQKDNKSRNYRMFGNVFARLDIMDKVQVNTRLGFNFGQASFVSFSPPLPEVSEPIFNTGIGEGQNEFREWTWSNTLTYVDTYAGRHNVNVLLGQEANQSNFRQISGSLQGMITSDINARYIQDAVGNPETKDVTSFGSVGSLLSFFGKVDYNFDNRYYLSATVRRDGSSRLGPNNRWGTFPAFSAGWRVSNESFMQDNDLLSNVMLRVGYGVTGNQNIPGGRAFDLFGGGTGNTFYDIRGTGSSLVTGFRQTSLGNQDLKWEENTSVNAGLDLELFDGSLSFALDVYQRDTDNLLFAPPIPATAGLATPPIVNIGKMRNTGFDLQIGHRGNISRDLSYNVSLNGSHYKNEILRIDGDTEEFFGQGASRFGNAVLNRVGHPIGAFYGLVFDGFFNSDAEVAAHAEQIGAQPGRIRFQDVNGDGVINAEDRTIIGDPHPDFTAGLDLGLQYKNWDFNANFFGTFGNDIFETQKEFYVFRNFNANVRRDLLTQSWTPQNMNNAKFPQLDQGDTFSRQFSSFFVEDGSYVRLRSLQVGYTFPPDVIPGMRSLRVYALAENLFTITNYPGLDPSLPAQAASSAGLDLRDQARGIDRGSYPTSRVISFGVSAVFN